METINPSQLQARLKGILARLNGQDKRIQSKELLQGTKML